MRKIILFLCSFAIHFTIMAQTWRSAYYPSSWTPPVTKNFYDDAFLQDYSYAGYHRGENQIPNPSGTIYDVTKAPYNADKTGTTDATTAIQNAINAAQSAGGGIVYLPAGTYKLDPGSNTSCLKINKSNIVLKGDGIGKTFLLNTSYKMNNKAIISVSGSASWTTVPSTKALITSDLMNPTTIIPIDNPSLFAVGDLVILRNFINDDWITEHKETGWLGYGSNLRGLMYCREIMAVDVNNKTITIDIPIRYALKTRDASCVFKLNNMISEVGLQDFSIANVQHPGTTGWGESDYTTSTNSSYDCSFSYIIKYNTIMNSWIKNVSTYQPSGNTTKTQILSNGILVQNAKNVTVDNCTMSYAQYGGGGGNGYAYRVSANEVLISNSTASYVRHGFVFSSMWCSGNVFHNCIDKKTGFQCGNTGSMSTSGWGSDHHMHFSHSNLIDQCYSENSAFVAFYRPYGSAPLHNLTSAHTAFWNITSGGTKGFCVWTQQSRYGYAIGTSGTSATIKTNENSTGSAAKTNPVDISEGQGLGATLEPQSLYLDQLSKRLVTVSIDSIALINAVTDLPMSDYTNLGTDITLSENMLSGTLHNMYAYTTGGADSVIFTYSLNGEVGQKKEGVAPYALKGDGSGYTSWTITEGEYNVTAAAYKGGIKCSEKTVHVSVNKLTIPGIVEAEYFDAGEDGIAYHDIEPLNQGQLYRLNSGVDIEECSSGGYNVGWVKASEYLNYSVTVEETAYYRCNFQVASTKTTGMFNLLLDGVNVWQSQNLPNTGGWQNWESVETILPLTSGNHILTIEITGSDFNFDKFIVSKCQTQSIELQKGWNLISINLIPGDGTEAMRRVSTIFTGLDVDIVKNANGFWKAGQISAFNSLTTITAGEGYLVYMNAPGVLSITGSVQTLHATSPQPGWQLIGCQYQTTTPFTTDFNATNTSIIKNFDGFWEPEGNLNSITDLEPGKGYFVKGK